LLLSRWPAFTAGRTQADYLRQLRVHLERLIAKNAFVLITAGDRLKLNASSAL
jgi:hypothetical protein